MDNELEKEEDNIACGINVQRQTIDKRFQEIVSSLNKDMDPKAIMNGFYDIMGNKIMYAVNYDDNSTELTLYRITKKYEGFNPEKKACYSYPPTQKQNRANLSGYPVLYASTDSGTAITEMKQSIGEEEKVYLSKWKINFTKGTIVQYLIINSKTIQDNHLLNPVARLQSDSFKDLTAYHPETLNATTLYEIEKMGDLFTEPGVDLYHITSAYAHNTLYSANKNDLSVSILAYPSVENKHGGINFAIHPDFADSGAMTLSEVYEISIKENKLHEDKGSVRIIFFKKGIFSNGIFSHWSAPCLEITFIDFENLELITYDGHSLKGKDTYLSMVNDTNNTIKKWVSNLMNNNETHQHISNAIRYDNEDSLFDKTFEFNILFAIQIREKVKITMTDRTFSISKMTIPLKVKMEYRHIEFIE